MLPGKLAENMLAECGNAVLLVCTLGAGFDRMLKEWEVRDMARAAVMDVCGSAWTESVQADFLRATDAGRKLGITVNESFLMMPCKTVTAVIGLSGKLQGAKIRGCAYCAMREDCAYRKGGKFCGV